MGLKTAYICLFYGQNAGPEERVLGMARAASALGIDAIDFYILNEAVSRSDGNVHYVKIKNLFPPLFYYKMLFKRYDLIKENIKIENYDLILLRYPFGDKSGIAFTRDFNVVTEHHTDEVSETLVKYEKAKSLPSRIFRKKIYALETASGHEILSNVKKLVAVTGEIRDIEQKRAGRAMPATVISNGIDCNKIKQTGFKPFDGKHLSLAFVGSHWQTLWNGGDRLLKSLAAYKGNVQITLNIAGDSGNTDSIPSAPRTTVKTHGRLEGAKLDEFISEANLAVSTLGLFRKKMKQACSLKTREYTARGIPFITAYDDPDLAELKDSERFFLQFPNDESVPDAERIIDFAQDMTKRREELSSAMRAYAVRTMDWKAKMKHYMEFLES